MKRQYIELTCRAPARKQRTTLEKSSCSCATASPSGGTPRSSSATCMQPTQRPGACLQLRNLGRGGKTGADREQTHSSQVHPLGVHGLHVLPPDEAINNRDHFTVPQAEGPVEPGHRINPGNAIITLLCEYLLSRLSHFSIPPLYTGRCQAPCCVCIVLPDCVYDSARKMSEGAPPRSAREPTQAIHLLPLTPLPDPRSGSGADEFDECR